MTEIGIFRFFNLFSRVWKIGEKYKADKIGDKTEPYLILISILKRKEEKLFQKYFVFFYLLGNIRKIERSWNWN